jgi:hypothetical protein
MKVVEQVGPVDGDRLLILIQDADHALIRGSAPGANAVGDLVVVLEP